MRKEIEQTLGYTNWLFLSLSVITVMFFLLSNVSKCEATEFCATSIFFIVFMGSVIMLLILYIIPSTKERLKGENNIKLFFMQDLTFQKLKYVPFGIIGVLIASYAISASGIEYAPFIAIAVSGIIMMYAFDRTHAIGVPILIHGAYNVIVVFLRSSSGLSSFPITVPEVGIPIQTLGKVASDIIFQLTLVAPSEELFKVFVIAFIIVATEGRFHTKGGWKLIGYAVAIFLWVVYHGIQAVK